MPTLADNSADDTIVIAQPGDGVTRHATEKPVFLDPTERRRRILRRVAVAACVAVAVYGVLLVTALFGGSDSPSFLLPLSGGKAPATSAPGEAPNGTSSPVAGPNEVRGQQTVGPAAASSARTAPAAVAAARPAPAAVQPGATAGQPTSAPTVTTAPPTAARNSHAPTSPPGWTKRGASTP